MPRIQADSVAEHVAQQEAAVFDAAIRLFCDQGYAQVSLGDVAAEVGLARNSLYRYFPDKAHILVRWFRTELPIQAERSRQLLSGDEPPVDRVVRWADDQLDYARQPEHALIAALSDVAPNLDAETRAELADSHRQLLAPLSDTLAEAGLRSPDDRAAVADLIGGLVLAAAQREQRLGDDPVVREHLATAIRGLMAPTPRRTRRR
ncbi:MAG: TetR/AcrR family transcriptional regulator [Acidimicrobiales bacterium]